jgi:hypothetical protein
MAVLCGRAGRLTSQNVGFRPGQYDKTKNTAKLAAFTQIDPLVRATPHQCRPMPNYIALLVPSTDGARRPFNQGGHRSGLVTDEDQPSPVK